MKTKKDIENRFPRGSQVFHVQSRQDNLGLWHFDILQEGTVLEIKAGKWPYLTDYHVIVKRSDGEIDSWFYRVVRHTKPEAEKLLEKHETPK